MEPFTRHRGIVAPLERANIDTDAIIPKQFLKSIRRTGFGEHLFEQWRYREDGSEQPDFILNREPYRRASILVAGNNFGCGSSREHAVWAVRQFGFRAVVAPWCDTPDGRTPGFADIFRNNSFKNGLLLVELPEAEVQELFTALRAQPGLEATLDLEAREMVLHAAEPRTFALTVDETMRTRLLQGLDDIGLTLAYEKELAAFERRHELWLAG